MTAGRRPSLRSKKNASRVVLLLLTAAAVLVLSAPTETQALEDGFTDPTGCFCHSALPDPSVTVEVVGLPAVYDPLGVYPLAITVSGGPATPNGGFYLSADGGTFSDPSLHAQVLGNTVTHSDNEARFWTVNWTAPQADYGTVGFSVFGNAANGDGLADDSDLWNSAEYESVENRAIPLIPTDLQFSVPRSVGEGEEFTLGVVLTDDVGQPVVDALITFTMHITFGKLNLGNATTDANGTASLNYTLAATGEFLMDANFRGGRGYREASATAILVVEGSDEPVESPWLTGDQLAVLVVTTVLAGVWGSYAYVAYQVYRISRE